MRRISVITVVLVGVTGCQMAPEYLAYKPGTTQSVRQVAFDQCKIESLREIPQNMAMTYSPGYYNPGTLSCSTYGNYTSCNRIGEVNIPGSVGSYDANDSLRNRYLMRCMEAKGYRMIKGVPLCKSEALRRAALNEPQPADPSGICASGVPLDR